MTKVETSPMGSATELVILLLARLRFLVGEVDDDPTGNLATADLIDEVREFLRGVLD
jgi:hypothetical protein